MSMSRKTYVEVAKILADELEVLDNTERRPVVNIARNLAGVFARDNGSFDRERFYAAVGLRDYERR